MIDCSKTANYLSEKLRMTKKTKIGLCKTKCSDCPLCGDNNGKGLSCAIYEMYYPKKAIEAVQRWSDEHPPKTYLSEFLKHYPNVQLYDAGIPKGICPYHLGLMSKDNCRKDHYCLGCWNQPIPAEGGEE